MLVFVRRFMRALTQEYVRAHLPTIGDVTPNLQMKSFRSIAVFIQPSASVRQQLIARGGLQCRVALLAVSAQL